MKNKNKSTTTVNPCSSDIIYLLHELIIREDTQPQRAKQTEEVVCMCVCVYSYMQQKNEGGNDDGRAQEWWGAIAVGVFEGRVTAPEERPLKSYIYRILYLIII